MKRMLLVAVIVVLATLPATGQAAGFFGAANRLAGGGVQLQGAPGRPAAGAVAPGRGGGFFGAAGTRADGWTRSPLGDVTSSGPHPGSDGWVGHHSTAPRADLHRPRHSDFDHTSVVLTFGYPYFGFYYPYSAYWGYYPYAYYPYGYYPGYVYAPVYIEKSEPAQRQPAAPASVGDQMSVQWLRNGRLRVGWSGDPAKVKQVEFSLLDTNRRLLELRVVRTQPFNTTFTAPPHDAVYLQTAVVYGDGSVDSAIRPLPDGDEGEPTGQ